MNAADTRRLPLSLFLARAADHLARARESGETLVLTDRGKPIVVLSPVQDEDDTEELLAVLEGARDEP